MVLAKDAQEGNGSGLWRVARSKNLRPEGVSTGWDDVMEIEPKPGRNDCSAVRTTRNVDARSGDLAEMGPACWTPTKNDGLVRTGNVARLGGLCLLQKRRSLVGAGSPRGWDRDVEKTQIDAELAAVLIPMVKHDVAQKLNARHSPHFTVTLH